VLTSVDPDDVVTTFQLGQVATDYRAIRRTLATFNRELMMWETAGHRALTYVREHHTTATIVDTLERVLVKSDKGSSVRGSKRD
jgi:hypothetical protein